MNEIHLDPALQDVTITICALCLAGEGGECHSPGCLFWVCPAPNAEQAERIRWFCDDPANSVDDELRADDAGTCAFVNVYPPAGIRCDRNAEPGQARCALHLRGHETKAEAEKRLGQRPEATVVAVDSFGVQPTYKEVLLIEALGNVLVKAGMLLPGPMSGPEVLAHAGLFCDDSAADRTRSG